MKNFLPNEAIDAFGAAALARQAAVQLEALMKRTPELAKILDNSKGVKAESQSNPFDVEISGDEDEIQEWLTEGFLTIDDIGDIGKPIFPMPDLPPRDPCDAIQAALRSAVINLAVQQRTVDQLQSLVDGLGKNPNPIVVIFAALFKGMLEEATAVRNQAAELVGDLRAEARRQGCTIFEVLVRRG
ncbi:MAG: hypothetical protein QNJ20_10680 [Paracoccaceae bacterium]|nr:hypothetical protein [Paracoccaceae bacterium]